MDVLCLHPLEAEEVAARPEASEPSSLSNKQRMRRPGERAKIRDNLWNQVRFLSVTL